MANKARMEVGCDISERDSRSLDFFFCGGREGERKRERKRAVISSHRTYKRVSIPKTESMLKQGRVEIRELLSDLS